MAAGEHENGSLLRYRISEVEKKVDAFDEKLDRVQSTLNRLLFTIATGSIGVVLSVLIGSGKL